MGYYLNSDLRTRRLVSTALAGLLACTLTGAPAFAASGSTSKAIAPTLKDVESILVFPPTNSAGDGFANSASTLGTEMKLKINGIGRYHATSYVATLPAIQRGLNVDDTLTIADLTPPFSSPAKAKKITNVVGSDAFVLTSLDTETVNQTAGTVQLTATVQVYSPTYPDPIKTFTVSGSSASSGAADEMSAVELRAIDNVAGKIVSSLSPGFNSNTPVTSIPRSGSGKKLGGSSFLLLVLAGVLVGVIANGAKSGGGSSSSTGTTGGTGGTGGSGGSSPPPPPTTN